MREDVCLVVVYLAVTDRDKIHTIYCKMMDKQDALSDATKNRKPLLSWTPSPKNKTPTTIDWR